MGTKLAGIYFFCGYEMYPKVLLHAIDDMGAMDFCTRKIRRTESVWTRDLGNYRMTRYACLTEAACVVKSSSFIPKLNYFVVGPILYNKVKYSTQAPNVTFHNSYLFVNVLEPLSK